MIFFDVHKDEGQLSIVICESSLDGFSWPIASYDIDDNQATDLYYQLHDIIGVDD